MKILLDTNNKTLDEVLNQLKDFLSDKLAEGEKLNGVQTFYIRKSATTDNETYFIADEERTKKIYKDYKKTMDNAVLDLNKYMFSLDEQINELEHLINLDESYLTTAEKLGRDKTNIAKRKALLSERKSKLRSITLDYDSIKSNLERKTYICWGKYPKCCNVVLVGEKIYSRKYIGFNATSKKLFTYTDDKECQTIFNAVLQKATAIIGNNDCIRYYKE